MLNLNKNYRSRAFPMAGLTCHDLFTLTKFISGCLASKKDSNEAKILVFACKPDDMKQKMQYSPLEPKTKRKI